MKVLCHLVYLLHAIIVRRSYGYLVYKGWMNGHSNSINNSNSGDIATFIQDKCKKKNLTV